MPCPSFTAGFTTSLNNASAGSCDFVGFLSKVPDLRLVCLPVDGTKFVAGLEASRPLAVVVYRATTLIFPIGIADTCVEHLEQAALDANMTE